MTDRRRNYGTPQATTCRNGHPRTPETVTPQGRCRICRAEAYRERTRSKRRSRVYRTDPMPSDFLPGGPLADPRAPSAEAVAQRDVIVRAIIEDARRQRLTCRSGLVFGVEYA